MRLYATLIGLFVALIPAAHAQDGEDNRRTLRGLKGVEILVEKLQPEVEQNGLTVAAIRTDVELKLRQAGIPVLDSAFGNALLVIGVSVLPSGALWPYAIRVEVRQAMILARDHDTVLVLADTWDVGSYGVVGKLKVRGVRDDVKDEVDQFINAYLAVNPKK